MRTASLGALSVTHRDRVDLHLDAGRSEAVDRSQDEGRTCAVAHQGQETLGVLGFINAAVVAVEGVKLGMSEPASPAWSKTS